MMADETELVRLLRLFETTYEQTRGMPWIGTVRPEQAFKRAADTIEALQREGDAMREALLQARAFVIIHGPGDAFPDVIAKIDAALSGEAS